MDFYTQTMVELILALGGAMVVGNIFAILKRKKDRQIAQDALKKSNRTVLKASGNQANNENQPSPISDN